MTAPLYSPKFQFGFPFSLLQFMHLLRNFPDISLSNLPHLLALCPRVILPRLLPESPTPIKVVFFKLLSRLSTTRSVLEKLQETYPRGHALVLLCPHPTSPPVLDGCSLLFSKHNSVPHRQSTYSGKDSPRVCVCVCLCLFPSLHQRRCGCRAHACVPGPRQSSRARLAQEWWWGGRYGCTGRS